MKSFLRAAAATGVAAATLAAGISFGPAATADPAAVAAEASSGVPVQFASNEPRLYVGTPYYGYVDSFGNSRQASTAGDAIKYAAILRAVPTGQTTANGFPTYFIKAPNGNCVAHEHLADGGGSWDIITGLSCGTVGENGRWFLEPSKGLRLEDGYTVSTGFTPRGGQMAAIRGYATKDRWALFPETLGVWAKAVSVDIEAGTAQLADGVAPPAASSVEVSYEDKTGKTARFDEDVIDGTWSASLRNLKLGVTTVHLTAFDGAEVVAEADVEVDLPVTPLTAEATFGDELDEVATISGTATAETVVKLFHGEKQIASTTSLKDGSYSIPVNAPNMAGAFDLTVTQTIRGEDATPKELSIDYGAGVSITSPAQGVELQPGDQLAITGAAQKSSKIRVYEKGKPEAILAETTAGKTTDTYRVVLRDLEDREYQLVVDALSKGYNHTTAELSVNPGKSVELDPATVTTESFTPGKTNTFEGTATKDATLRVVNRWGTDLLGKDVTVKTDGTWSFDRAVSASSTKFEFRLVQTKGNLSTTSEVFTIAADTANSLVDPTVTAPTAVVLGVNNTFTGTATEDASLKIVNASGTDLLGHPVTVTGSGDWTFDRVVSWNAKNFTFYIEQTKNGTTKKTGPYVINPADPAASLVDPTVTAPTAVALGVNNTFTGTATEDASLKIVNASGTDLLGHPVTVTGSGDWTFDRVVSWNAKNFTFYIEQTKNGTTKKTGPYVINPADPAASLVDPTVTAPTAVALGVNNTFTGTATEDASLKIVNASGTDLLGHPVTVTGSGDWTFDRVVSWNAKNFTFYIEQTKNGATKKTGPYVINPADPAASLVDPTVTAPTAVALGVNNTFTGTATEDASLKIVNASGTDLLGHPVTVTGSGDWTFDRVVSWNAKNFTFYIEQTKNGATKKTGPYVINPATN